MPERDNSDHPRSSRWETSVDRILWPNDEGVISPKLFRVISTRQNCGFGRTVDRFQLVNHNKVAGAPSDWSVAWPRSCCLSMNRFFRHIRISWFDVEHCRTIVAPPTYAKLGPCSALLHPDQLLTHSAPSPCSHTYSTSFLSNSAPSGNIQCSHIRNL